MNKHTELKNYIILYFKNLSRERIAIFICIPLALIALSICAIMLLSIDKKNVDVPDDAVFVTEAQTEKQNYPSNSPYSLEFESLENGFCAISGIGNFEEKELIIPKNSPNGEIVVEIKANAFKNCDILESITLPDTVERIGKGAFKGCNSLVYIDVDMKNEFFSSVSGVLFSKSRNRLIFYPPNKVDEKYYLNPNVKFIEDNAFENTKNLKAILYPQSTAEFEAISIGNGNDVLHSLPITCNYVGGDGK